jgi:hypothetical protein
MTIVNHDAIARGFTISSQITQVVTNSSGRIAPLNGSALSRYEANSTWVVNLGSGQVLTFPATSSFALGSASFVSLGSGGSAPVTVTYLNPEDGAVTFALSVSELCAPPGVGPVSVSYTVG